MESQRPAEMSWKLTPAGLRSFGDNSVHLVEGEEPDLSWGGNQLVVVVDSACGSAVVHVH